MRPVPAALRRHVLTPACCTGAGAGPCLAGGSEFRRYHCKPVETLHRVLRSFRHLACCSLQQRETPTAEARQVAWATSPMAARQVGNTIAAAPRRDRTEGTGVVRTRRPSHRDHAIAIRPLSGNAAAICAGNRFSLPPDRGSPASRVCATIADPDRIWPFVTGNRQPGGSRMAPGRAGSRVRRALTRPSARRRRHVRRARVRTAS